MPFSTPSHKFWQQQSSRLILPSKLPQSGAQIDIARSVLDHEITYAKEYLRIAHGQRNLLTPIMRLPAEVFLSIMHYASIPSSASRDPYDTWYSKTNRKAEFTALKTVIRCSHVSQRWREIVINAPLLWSCVCVENPYWAKETIERSGDIPLTIVQTNQSTDAIWPAFAASVHRLRALTMCLFRDDDFPQFTNLFPQVAPRLEVLQLQVAKRYGSAAQDTLPSDLFAPCSNLRILKLEGSVPCGHLLSSVILRRLVHLELSHLDRRRYSIQEICQILAMTNELQLLALEGVLDDQHLRNEQSTTVYLPHLQRIKITDVILACVELAKHLCIPDGAHATYVLHKPIHPFIQPTVVPHLMDSVSSSIVMPVITIHLAVSEASNVYLLHCWNSHLSSLRGDIECSDVSNPDSVLSIRSSYAKLLQDPRGGEPAFSLSDADSWDFLDVVEDFVVYFVDGTRFPNRFDIWRAMLQRLNRVKRLVLGSKTSLFVLALAVDLFAYGPVSSPISNPAADNTGHPLLPNLSVICFRHWKAFVAPDTIPPLLLDCLRRIASRRERGGPGLRELHFVDCKISEGHITELGALADRVYTDASPRVMSQDSYEED